MDVDKSPISILQECTMAQKIPLPTYNIVQDGLNFKCVVSVDKIIVTGVGDSKKKAKNNAAEKALNIFALNNNNIPRETADVTYTLEHNSQTVVNAVGKLNELCSKHCNIYPTYSEIATVNSRFSMKCSLFNHETTGEGRTKKEAKQVAASVMLNKVQESDFIKHAIDSSQKDPFIKETRDVEEIFKLISISKNKPVKTVTDSIPKGSMVKTIESIDFLFMRKTTNVYDLKDAFMKLRVTFKITQFQKQPLVLCLKTDATNVLPSCTFVHCGPTYDETELVLLKKALDAICIILR